MTHAEMVEENERHKRECAAMRAKFEAEGQKYRNIVNGVNQAMEVFVHSLNAPWREFEAELRAMDREGI